MDALKDIPSFILTLLVMGVIFFLASVWRNRQEKRAHEQRVKKNPELGRPVTPEEREAFEAWLTENALPHIALIPGALPADAQPVSIVASRLGGPAAMPAGSQWPTDKHGKPMVMLAQINFAEMGDLPEFPDKGLLQFFIQSDDLFGMNFDNQLDADIKIIWHEDPSVLTDSLPQPIDYKADYSPFMKRDVLERGVGLMPTAPKPQRPEWGVWFVDEKVDTFYDRPGGEDMIDEIFDAMKYNAHRMGGHPSFTQQDPRAHGEFQNYDRVLLQIGCDKYVMFGDSGECTFFITAEDLKARRFDRLLYNWDCC